MPAEDVLEAQITALEKLMKVGFEHINERLDEFSQRMVGRVRIDRFEALCSQVDKLDKRQDRHDTRIDKLEKVSFLLGIIGTVAMVVLGALAVAIATGRLQMVWK